MVQGTNRIVTTRDIAGNFALKRVQTRCNNPMPATAKVVTDRSCSATMYSVGYTLNNRHLELYRTCYDRANVRTLFTSHQVYKKSFFLTRPCTRFTTDNLISNADAATFTTASIFNKFRSIFGNNQRYIRNNQDVVLNRGHLTPSADFLYLDQACATFKYINVVPQFRTINDRNWETIERYVRNQITQSFLRIKTGAVGILTLPDSGRTQRRVILGSGNKNPVPLWMYKIVRTEQNRPLHAFLVYNNIFARTRPRAPRWCTSIRCPITLAAGPAAGYTFCCNPTTFNP
ncbi:uncharacterized protein LOC115621951 [Scaptodrosophila lebanonensis]|uniref:Uncharacterized protein LOC115621951 n=1 Tax=Drosophila lebanonensis TaxID=7225 RepID=A0A6J2T9N2_DROLE|nr:uncharacterized protein LOC115621951 [Scaptodrosophila lebanonensis]